MVPAITSKMENANMTKGKIKKNILKIFYFILTKNKILVINNFKIKILKILVINNFQIKILKILVKNNCSFMFFPQEHGCPDYKTSNPFLLLKLKWLN